MKLKSLTYQSKLNVVELDSFLSQFLEIFLLPIDEPVVEDRELLINDIYLGDKGMFLKSLLEAYEKNLKREKRMAETDSLTELNLRRGKLFSGHMTYIANCETDTDEAVCAAAVSFRRLTEQFKYFSRLTNDAKSAFIRKYIAAVQGEEYASAYAVLALDERTVELQNVNEQYISLSKQRDEAEKNITESPSEIRQQCVDAYRELVALVNFALKKNKYYLYEEKAASLVALTERTQELVNRRRNAAEKPKEEGTDTPTDEIPTEDPDSETYLNETV